MDLADPRPGSGELGALITAWERAFLSGATWSGSLIAGMGALAETLEADPSAADACVLTRVPDPAEAALIWHRELVRARITAALRSQWERYGEHSVPSVYFEIFVGAICTALRDRVDRGGGYDELATLALELWGGAR
ncbi:hypothetical protein PAI11_43430 [Patulibacter medicamentivorans]|uniref:Transcriptional regulator TetR family n=1 Tax=Patulibacter medicamentivorans TaxID=1097667 RepID=H0EBW0_9ACTN|nr:hypothetical protein [Patulibacter medicamentivorans]EHN08837.1 hypothetical protein PAI11_43430 [Patulibacter medicamentivorans]